MRSQNLQRHAQSAGLQCQLSETRGARTYEIAAIIAVFEFPPSDSFSSQVNTESRYGTKSSFFFLPLTGSLLACASAAMTLPRVVSDLLMFEPSRSRAPYGSALGFEESSVRRTVAPVDVCRSDPARSTRDILETFSPTILVIGSRRFWVS